jgi:heme-degrading monooxygenase HmoA
MEEDVGSPVILINKFSVIPEEFEQFLEGWAAEAEKFKEQPGFISTQLHKGMGVAVPSLTMQFGNRQDISRWR